MTITLLGIDLAKTSFQLHGVDGKGKAVLKKKLSREELAEFIQQLHPCRIAMEACGGAHFWKRKFERMGHRVDLIAAKFVKPFVKSQKNDRNDAEAIVEAASRPTMRYVSGKTLVQQDLQSLHRARENLVACKTALVNQCRGLLMEYGITISEGISKFKNEVQLVVEDAENELTHVIRELIFSQYELFKIYLERQKDIELKIKLIAEQNLDFERILKVPGVGPMTASMFIASVGDVNTFKNGRHLAAWVGLVPRQISTGGKSRLVGITKAGDSHLRTVLIHGARALIGATVKKQKKDPTSQWILNLLDKKGWNKTAVAVANKNCRIMWSLMKHQAEFKTAV